VTLELRLDNRDLRALQAMRLGEPLYSTPGVLRTMAHFCSLPHPSARRPGRRILTPPDAAGES